MGAAAGEIFFGGKEEQAAALSKLDTRAQSQSKNPGFLMVKPDFASGEIAQTQLFKVPAYDKNYCEKPAAPEKK
jgi:hypothetical protein